MLTPGQASEQLRIPPATLRRYARQFSDHLSATAHRRGKSRRYNAADLVIFGKIRRHFSAGKNPAEVGALLAVSDDPTEKHDLALKTDSALVATFAQNIVRLEEQLETLVRDLDATRTELEETRQQQADQAEQLATMVAWMQLPRLKRIFSSPPIDISSKTP